MKPTCCMGIPFEALDSQMRSLLTLSGKQVDAMAATRKVVELPIGERELAKLQSIARSRTESSSRVVRARIVLHYRDDPSCYAVGRAVGVTHQTVQRCLARASRFGVMAALDDSPRPGKEPAITVPARAWLVSLACQKAKEVGYPHELWTTRLLARHSREHGPAAGHASLARIAQGTICKLLAEQELKPHKVRYYLSGGIRRSRPGCRTSFVFIRRLPSCERWKPTPPRVFPKLQRRRWSRPRLTSRSSLIRRSRASRRSPTRHRTCPRSRASMTASRAITNTSGTAR